MSLTLTITNYPTNNLHQIHQQPQTFTPIKQIQLNIYKLMDPNYKNQRIQTYFSKQNIHQKQAILSHNKMATKGVKI